MYSTNLKTHFSNINFVIFATNDNSISEFFGPNQRIGLVSVCNKPIILHLINKIKQIGINKFTIVCHESQSDSYNKFFLQNSITSFNIISISDSHTTCQIIRMLPISKHTIIMPINLFTSMNFSKFLDFHISEQSFITIFSTQYKLEEKEKSLSPGIQGIKDSNGRYYLVFDETIPNRLVSILADESAFKADLDISRKNIIRDESLESMNSIDENEDFQQGMDIKPEHLSFVNSMFIDSTHQLTNCYILSDLCLEFLNVNDDLHSIENELIPRLLTSQDKVMVYFSNQDDTTLKINDCSTLFHVNLKCSNNKFNDLTPLGHFNLIDERNGYFLEGQIKVPETFKYNLNCVFGDNLIVLENTSIIRSIIGRNCKIGKKCRIINSVIYDHVIIEDNCIIENSLIGSDSFISSSSQISQCLIVSGYKSDNSISKKCLTIKN